MLKFIAGMFVAIVIMIPFIQELGINRLPVDVVLPEEFRAISHHYDNPDTVTAFLRKDTLFINFIPKNR